MEIFAGVVNDLEAEECGVLVWRSCNTDGGLKFTLGPEEYVAKAIHGWRPVSTGMCFKKVAWG